MNSNELYVGSLSYSVTDSRLGEMFAEYGSLPSASVIMDRHSGRSKGFGFVEMSSPEEAQAAAEAMNGQEMEGRAWW